MKLQFSSLSSPLSTHMSRADVKTSVHDCISIASERLALSASARLDSELLCAHALGITRSALLARMWEPLSEPYAEQFYKLVARRAQGEPVAYIIGTREFWGLEFKVGPDVLVPRPESELVVQEALSFCADVAIPSILDLGTGSGCLAIAVVHELVRRGKQPSCVAVDLSEAALRVAAENAVAHGVDKFCSFVQSNWCSERHLLAPPYDMIMANPPYISRAESTPRELTFEPQDALFSDEEGLCDAKLIIQQSISMLKPAGCLLVEVGAGKRKALAAWLDSEALPYSWDLLGDDRECDSFTVIRLIKQRIY